MLPESLKRLPRHRDFVERMTRAVEEDDRFVALLLGGSATHDAMDDQSDLDFVLVTREPSYEAVLSERKDFAEARGNLLVAFTGEHVGEPRLLICLYGPPLLHVDLKFVRPDALRERVEDPRILWERDGAASRELATSQAHYPQPDPQWIEDRFWTIVHYAASRAERGELLEATASVSWLATHLLGPLLLRLRGAQPCGVRRIEQVDAEWAARLNALFPEPGREACLGALEAAVGAYRDLRREGGYALERRSEAEAAVEQHLADLRARGSDESTGWVGRHSARLHRRRGRRP